MDRRKYTNDDFKEALLNYGFIYISGEYINANSKFKCYDTDGYIVYPCFDKLENANKFPSKFHKSNPDVIFNIKHYLTLHPECNCSYVSGEYINKKSNLVFKCNCGNTFVTTFEKIINGKKRKCDKCKPIYTRNLSFEQIRSNLLKRGFYLLVSENEFKGVTLTKLKCEDENGYVYDIVYDQIMRSENVKPLHVSFSNIYSIYNINLYLKKYTNGQYECLSSEYTSDKLLFRHVKCGRVFHNTWKNISKNRYLNSLTSNKTGLRCPYCEGIQTESLHASILKQVWLHEVPGTIVEERSCINPQTNCALPTDIVNHEKMIAIEIQSWFHDFEEQKEKDLIKKTFWESKKYSFYAIDHRNYSILEMVQIFFPYLKEIPSYVNLSYSKLDIFRIQELLNNGLTVKEISNNLGISSHRIYDAKKSGKIIYPSNYIRGDYSPVIQCDLNDNYIAEYPSIAEAKRQTGIKYISETLCSGKHFCSGYNWYYKKK